MSWQKAIPSKPIHQNDVPGVDSTAVYATGYLNDDRRTELYRPQVSINPSAVYSSGSLPAASGLPHQIIYVYDQVEGSQLQYSDGTNWKPLTF